MLYIKHRWPAVRCGAVRCGVWHGGEREERRGEKREEKTWTGIQKMCIRMPQHVLGPFCVDNSVLLSVGSSGWLVGCCLSDRLQTTLRDMQINR